MEKKIKNAFDSVTMPKSCDAEIQAALHRPVRRCRPLAAAACLVLTLLVLVQPPVVQALEDLGQMVTSCLYPNAQVTKQESFEDGMLISESGVLPVNDTTNGESYNGSIYDTEKLPTWLEIREDGLYFTANGEDLEIGSLISDEVPFTYQYTDARGYRYSIAVGGNYVHGEDTLYDVGFSLWIQEAPYDAETWLTSAGHYSKDNHGWVDAAWEIFGIPFTPES